MRKRGREGGRERVRGEGEGGGRERVRKRGSGVESVYA